MNKQQMKNVIAEYQSRKDLEGRIRRLRDAAERITTQLTGMPRGSSGEDRLAAIVSEITGKAQDIASMDLAALGDGKAVTLRRVDGYSTTAIAKRAGAK